MKETSSYNWKKKKFYFGGLFILAIAALTGVVMFLWNAILPDLIHVSRISYLQSLGLLVLCRILFGGFHFGKFRGGPPFANPGFREKFMNMSDEERSVFKQKWREHCSK